MTVVTTPQFYLLWIGAPLDPPKLVSNLLSFVTQRFSHLYKKEIRDGKDGKNSCCFVAAHFDSFPSPEPELIWRPWRYGPSKGIKFGCWVGREYWQLRQFFVRYFVCIVFILVHGDNLFAVMTFSRWYILDRRNGLRKKLIINFPLIFKFQSDGIARSYTLASQYAKEAVKQINKLSSSSQRDALITITQQILQRRK